MNDHRTRSPHAFLGSGSPARHICLLVFTLTIVANLQAQSTALSNAGVIAPSLSAALPDAPSSTATGRSSFGEEIGKGAVIIGKDELTFIKAPFQKKNLKWDLLFAGAVAPLIATDEHVLHATNPAWYGTSGTLSNALLATDAGVAGGILVTGLLTDNTHAKQTGVAAVRATIDSALMFEAMKLIFQRQRPFMSGAEGKFFSGNWGESSFPSGHSMFDWTLASVVAHEYPKWEVAAAMYGLALFGSGSRVTAGVHFPSDVVVGSTLGFLIGRYVAKQNDKLTGDSHFHPKSRLIRVEDAVLSHVNIGMQ